MAFSNPFRTPKHQTYKYIPRYWEQEEEERAERVRQALGKHEDPHNTMDMKSRISSGFSRRAAMKGNKYMTTPASTKKSNIRLLVIFFALILVTYILLSKYLPVLINYIEK